MLKKHPLALYITWIVALAVIPLPLIILKNSQLTTDYEDLFAYDVGILAYVWWQVIIFLSTRPRWLEKYIGIPSMYFLHASLGVAALIAATAHKFLSPGADHLVETTGDIAWYLAIVGIIYAIVFMSGWLVDRFKLLLHVLNDVTGQKIDDSVEIRLPIRSDYGANLKIGKQVFINSGAMFTDLGRIELEDKVLVGPNVTIISVNHPLDPEKRHGIELKAVLIKENAWLGANATILPGVTVGENAVVAAGAVVSKDVPANTVVAGVPAKVIKKIGGE